MGLWLGLGQVHVVFVGELGPLGEGSTDGVRLPSRVRRVLCFFTCRPKRHLYGWAKQQQTTWRLC